MRWRKHISDALSVRIQPAGRAIRAGQRDAVEQPGVFGLGGDLQGRDDDGGGDRPPGSPLRDPGVERAQLPCGAGQEGPSDDNYGMIKIRRWVREKQSSSAGKNS